MQRAGCNGADRIRWSSFSVGGLEQRDVIGPTTVRLGRRGSMGRV